MNLNEQVDTLRVQVAQDAATIHELRTCLEQEREGIHNSYISNYYKFNFKTS